MPGLHYTIFNPMFHLATNFGARRQICILQSLCELRKDVI